METIQHHLEEATRDMKKAYVHTEQAFSTINAGRAMPAMVLGLMVEYYGHPEFLQKLATVTPLDARTLTIQPWEQRSIPAIEKAISDSQLGFSTKNDGQVITATLPLPSEERRKNLVKLIRNESEKSRVAIRNVRRDYKEVFKKLQKEGLPENDLKRAEKQLQVLTDSYIDKINELLSLKEVDIMTV